MLSGKYEYVVVGAGIEGSATAYQLAKKGAKVLLLEQFPLPHNRGSSHGASRMIRRAYEEDYFCEMMNEAYSDWQELEKETGTKIYMKTGLVMISENLNVTESVAKILNSLNMKSELLTANQVNGKYPGVFLSDNETAVIDTDAGILKADKALRCLQEMFVRNGGEIRDQEPVRRIIPESDTSVMIETSHGTYRSNSAILCLGPWAPKFLKSLGLNLPLESVKTTVCFWRMKPEFSRMGAVWPCTVNISAEEHSYSLPPDEYEDLMKICWHGGVASDPDDRDRVSPAESHIDGLIKYVRRRFPCVEPKPSIMETCMYTCTPDESFILDRHPKHKNIIIGAGFSGTTHYGGRQHQ
ncbi:PREDICTED: peroxisomal sarcosine oxidase-like isoform X2 [Priapulus caudatus]|uniref:Peroxisomal sarcosine oxidase-like isoform X2 n=1 Tax=Priapulus caudatus TaxID=37621 RepID=A0ABM1DR28_PRICU|nr:PREDICTED: peroxisomal sarcosine oxidase-like isoform X2 [Priapulus caudatus]